jgi:hypothetical protein
MAEPEVEGMFRVTAWIYVGAEHNAPGQKSVDKWLAHFQQRGIKARIIYRNEVIGQVPRTYGAVYREGSEADEAREARRAPSRRRFAFREWGAACHRPLDDLKEGK